MALPRRIVIVGGGECGARTALALRERSFDGGITLVGEESDPPYERPPLSKAVLASNDSHPTWIASAEHLFELDVEWRPATRAVRLDVERTRVELADGASLRYDKLVLATGARARRPPMPGNQHVHLLRSFRDVEELRRELVPGARLLVVGGGFVGLEVAATAVRRGCEVSVVEFAQRLMSRVVPAAAAEVLRQRHLAAGCSLRVGTGVDRIERSDRVLRVSLTDGSELIVDAVVAGVGALPNTELAASAGLAINNGIAVDANLRTSDHSILAAGDCCSVPHPLYGNARVRLEAWRNAVDHAEVAAENLLGRQVVFDAVPWFWSDQYDLSLNMSGLHSFATSEVARRRADGTEMLFGLDAGGRVISACGVAVGTSMGRDIRLAERMIANRTVVAPAILADPAADLRLLATGQLSTTVSSIA